MGDVEGKSIKLNAVGKDGADITVEKDFSIHVEYENYYLCYEEALENEPVFIIKQPSLDIEEYDEDGIEEVYFPNMGLYSAGNGLFQFIKIGEPNLKEGTTEIDIKFVEFLDYLFANSGDMATQLWASAASQYDNMKDLLDYDKKSVVIRDEPNLKAGYFTTNRFGATNYNLVIVTCNQVYYAKNCRFHNGWDEDETADNEAFLDRLLKSIKIVNSGKIEKPQIKVSKFVLPTYEDGVRVSFDDFSVSIPDGLEYVTEDHLPDGDELANVLTSEYLIVAADKDCAGGLRKFKDASLGINIADQGSSNINPIFWEHIDEALDGKVNMTIGDSNVKFVKGGDGYIIGYGKGNECQSKDEPYWAVYYVVIMLKNKQYMCNLYFNSKKTTAKNYNQTLEDFCNGIEVVGGKKKKSASKEKKKTSEEKAALKEKSDLDEGILCGLKCDAESIYSSLTLIAKGLKGQKFEIPSQEDEADDDSSSDNEYDEEEYEEDNPIDDFTDYLYGIDGVDSSGLSYRYDGFRNSFELSIWTKYVRPVDLTLWIFPLDYYLEVKLLEADGTFNPNSLAKNLINKINELDKDKIFEQLKGDVKKAIDEGKEVESIVSYDYIQKQLSEYGNVFEAQGTQYEDRNDRIESVKKGDKLSLHREPDNEHDKNAIDIRNKSGSLGHLPWNAADLLSPAIDAGLIEAEAEVVEVTPLSQRSKKAKKALLNVRINISKTGSKKTKTPKSSSTSKSKNIGDDINNTEEKKKTDNKKAEEKKNIEEQKKIEERKKEEGKKKLEKELDSEAAKMVIEWRREYKELERVWRRRLDDHQRRISSKVYMSSYEVSTDMRKIVSDRDSYGKQYDSLIKEVDTSGKELVKNGCSSKGVKSIKDIIDEIIEESGALDIDFGTNGMMTMDLGRTKFSVSAASKRIQSWWNDKYNNSPDVKYNLAIKTMKNAENDQDYYKAASLFQDIGDYKDSQDKIAQCKEAALEIKYNTALKEYSSENYTEAIRIFKELGDYKDSNNKIQDSQNKELEVRYKEAIKVKEACGNEAAYKEVSLMFRSLGDYLDSSQMADECLLLAENARKDSLYSDALSYYESTDIAKIEIAKDKFGKLGSWKDSSRKIDDCNHKIEEINRNALLVKKKRRLKIVISIASVITVIILIAITLSMLKKSKYDSALNAYKSGNYTEAKRIFGTLKDYKDSKIYYFKSSVASAEKGNTITFGAFEQDNDTSNGKEPIEWTVLDVKDDKILVISKYVLIGQNMSEMHEYPSWSECGVRNWLNNTFISSAFTADEEEIILETDVKNENGNDTTDKAYILSKEELETLFPNPKDRITDATEWAKSNGKGLLNMCYSEGDPRHSCWWLRSQIYNTFPEEGYEFDGVDYAGETDEYGYSGDLGLGVRPVMWIKKYQ